MAEESAPITDSSDELLQARYWIAYLRTGFVVIATVSAAILAYLQVTPLDEHRPALSVVAVSSLVLAIVTSIFIGRVAAKPWRAAFSLGADVVCGLALTIVCIFDGGLESPLAYILVLPLLNAAAALSRKAVAWCAVATAGDVILLVLSDGDVSSETRYVVALLATLLGAIVLPVLISIIRTRLEDEQATYRHDLLRASLTDPLTGCMNQRAFDRHLKMELDRLTRYDSTFSLAIADVDMLKAVNDAYGHAAGDDALVSIGAALRSRSRPSDAVARIGGDEFAVILPATELREAAEAMRRIAEEINRSSGPTVSIGVAQVVAGDATPRRIFRDADSALYNAKVRGRATVCTSGDGSLDSINISRAERQGTWRADLQRMEKRVEQSEREKQEVLSGMQGASEEYLRGVLEALPQLFWTCSVEGPCDYLSPQWIDYTGVPALEQLGYRWLEQVHPDDRAPTMTL